MILLRWSNSLPHKQFLSFALLIAQHPEEQRDLVADVKSEFSKSLCEC